jgi:hypothetical protein
MTKSGIESTIKIHPDCHKVEVVLSFPKTALPSTNRQPKQSMIAVYVVATIFTLVFAILLIS